MKVVCPAVEVKVCTDLAEVVAVPLEPEEPLVPEEPEVPEVPLGPLTPTKDIVQEEAVEEPTE